MRFKTVVILFVIAFVIGAAFGVYFCNSINRRTISDLNQELADSKNDLNDAIRRNSELEAELTKGESGIGTAVETVKRIARIRQESQDSIVRTEGYNRESARLIDESLGILYEVGKTD